MAGDGPSIFRKYLLDGEMVVWTGQSNKKLAYSKGMRMHRIACQVGGMIAVAIASISVSVWHVHAALFAMCGIMILPFIPIVVYLDRPFEGKNADIWYGLTTLRVLDGYLDEGSYKVDCYEYSRIRGMTIRNLCSDNTEGQQADDLQFKIDSKLFQDVYFSGIDDPVTVKGIAEDLIEANRQATIDRGRLF